MQTEEVEQHSSPGQDEDEGSNAARLRSRASTNAGKTEHSAASSLPSPITPHPPKPRNNRGAPKKGPKNPGRRSSLNLKKDKKKPESHSPPPVLPDDEIPPDETNMTRCVCGEDNEEANDVIMFQCDKCAVWQHGPCVGLYHEFPGDYFCEQCRPDLHATGQYQKSTSAQRSKRSPSFTSNTSRRERVNTDAASLAAFLTDAGVKPEDQLSLGGFALPIFAQTRRQSNLLVDGSAPPTRKQTSGDGSPNPIGPSAEAEGTGQIPDPPKAKRKRSSEEPTDLSVMHDIKSNHEDENLKRPRVSPVPEKSPPIGPVKNRHSNGTSAIPLPPVGHGKQRRTRKLEELDESVKTKATTVFGGNSKASTQPPNTTSAKRGSPTKRAKEDGRRNKNNVTDRELTSPEGWGLPDHLSYLGYLLPSPAPCNMILEDGKIEPATRVKFPGKRATIADLKKRSKHLVDYLQKVQIETSDREKRNELITKSLLGKVQVESAVSSETLKIMDDLTRELYHWQEKYKAN